MKKILILGHMRSGKDTMAEILNDKFGLSFRSSSEAACDKFIFDELKDANGYTSKEECFNDRFNHRDEWYDYICDYNKDDRARLAKEILNDVDCYVGMRDLEEFEECINQQLFDKVIWVDASDRLPDETGSFNIPKKYADIIVDNNGTFDDFEQKVAELGEELLYV
jgi:dephospho-CoA kinase